MLLCMLTVGLRAATAAEIVLTVPDASGVSKGTVWIEGRPPASFTCTDADACVLRDVPERGWVYVEVEVGEDRWNWVRRPNDVASRQLEVLLGELEGLSAHGREPNRFIDLDGEPVVVVAGSRMARMDGRIELGPYDRATLQNGNPIREIPSSTREGVTTLAVRRVRPPPEAYHRLYGEGDPDKQVVQDAFTQETFGYHLPVGTWYSDRVNGQAASRRRWVVPRTGPIVVEDVELHPVKVTWDADDGTSLMPRREPGNPNVSFTERHWPLYVETGPGEGFVHPLRQERQLIGRSGFAAFWSPGQPEIHLHSLSKTHIRCWNLQPTDGGLEVFYLAPTLPGQRPRDLAEIRKGWVLTSVDDVPTAGWTRLHLQAHLAEGDGDDRHTLVFRTPNGSTTIELRRSHACPTGEMTR